MAQITTNGLRAKWTGKERWLTDGGSRGAGRLVARLTQTRAHFYFQYVLEDGRKRAFPLGPFDVQGKDGLSLAAARQRCAELSALYRAGTTDIHSYLERQRVQAEHARQAEQAVISPPARVDAQQFSLRKILTAYVEYLQNAGKPSSKEVANVFKNHVFSDPVLPDREASLVSTDEFVSLIGKVVAAGHGRTAAKLRSYLRAAYALGIRAKTNPAAPQSMRDFAIHANPVAAIDALSQYNRAHDRNLSAPELAAFLKRVQAEPEYAMRDALEVCIYAGGQRPTQLLRLRRTDVDLSAGLITLYDMKGRRKQPRPHVVPLTKRAAEILERRTAGLAGTDPVFSTDGRTAMSCETLTNFVRSICSDMLEAQQLCERFTLRDLRRTLETLLASWGVSSDTRKHLQSHGLSGVQHRHYDRYEYLKEKRAALKLLLSRLDRLLMKRVPHRKANRAQQGPTRLERRDVEAVAD